MAILDFLYFGEANVYQENLDSFLAIAEELELKGLTGQTTSDLVREEEKPIPKTLMKTKELLQYMKAATNRDSVSNAHVPNSDAAGGIFRTTSIPNQISGNLQALDEKVKSMMTLGQNMITAGKLANGTTKQQRASICKVCGKEGQGIVIRDHIEANHLEGISIPCIYCDKVFSSRNSVSDHKRKYHK